MPTIEQTLMDIEKVQQDIQSQLSSGKMQQSPLIDDLIHIINVYHFDLLAHSCLDDSETKVSTESKQFLEQYHSLSRKDGIHSESIRWLNIGGLIIVCNLFEKFVRETHAQLFTDEPINHLKDAYEQILENKNINTDTMHRMVREFSLIRFIRNSFYHGDSYKNSTARVFDFGNETYNLEEGKLVKPMRLMTAITLLWQHYSMIMSSV